MILADTSVWVQHFRQNLETFAGHLIRGEIAIHSIVIGELATGNLPQRGETLSFLASLPRVLEASPEECLEFIERHRLFGLGIGWSDVQLLTAAKLSSVTLWSLDKKLAAAASKL